MGRPRQSIKVIEARGKKHLTKAEIEERLKQEIEAPNDKIEPPAYLTDKLKDEFNRLANELKKIDIMTNLDNESLARFVVSEYNYQKITKKLLKTSVDNEKYYDYLLMQEKAFKQSRQAATDLGLTISSRCKLVVPKKEEKEEKPKNKFANFI